MGLRSAIRSRVCSADKRQDQAIMNAVDNAPAEAAPASASTGASSSSSPDNSSRPCLMQARTLMAGQAKSSSSRRRFSLLSTSSSRHLGSLRASLSRRWSRPASSPSRRQSRRRRRKSVAITQDENAILQRMLASLTASDLEMAARAASYRYLTSNINDNDDERRQQLAKTYAVRFLRSKKDEAKALANLQDTLRFRREFQVDQLRTAFDNDNNNNDDTRQQLQAQLASRALYVQGHDRHGRSTFIFVPRLVSQHDATWTIKSHLYTLERALATSHHPSATVNAIVDFGGFRRQHAPPLHIAQQFMTTLRAYYAGSVHLVVLVNAPATFHVLWSCLSPLLGTKTRQKIHFVKCKHNGDHKVPALLAQHYDPQQLPTWIGGSLPAELNVEEYLYQTPFDQAFGEF